MVLRKAEERRRVEFDMTPMIDCCFQLIIFFMLSLRMMAPEGDLDMKMPLVSGGQATPTRDLVVDVRLASDAAGELSGIRCGDRTLSDFGQLRREIAALAHSDAPAGARPEVVLRCDPRLDYRHTVAAVTAVAGFRDPQGGIVRLTDRVRFGPWE
jgi:biopolymer transport protein ExbD